MIPRRNRLRSTSEIRATQTSGVRATAAAARIAAVTPVGEVQPGADMKIAVTATRAVGGAVQRNRAKRRLRAAAFSMIGDMLEGSRAVYASTRKTCSVNFQDLVKDVRIVSVKAGVLRRD